MKKNTQHIKNDTNHMNTQNKENLQYEPIPVLQDNSRILYSVFGGFLLFMGMIASTMSMGVSPATPGSQSAFQKQVPKSLNDAPSLKEIMSNIQVENISQKEATSLMNDAPSLSEIKKNLTIEIEPSKKKSQDDLVSMKSNKKPRKS